MFISQASSLYSITLRLSRHENSQVEEFYEQPEKVIKAGARKYILVMLADWNAKTDLPASQQWTEGIR